MKTHFLTRSFSNPALKALMLIVSLWAVAPVSAVAQANYGNNRGMFDGFIVVNSKRTNDIVYDLNPQTSTANSDFDGSSFGAFTVNESLVIRGGEIKTYKNSGCNVTGASLYYYIHPAGTSNQVPISEFTRIGLNFGANIGSNGDQRWGDANNPTNTTNVVGSFVPGSYVIDVFIAADFGGCFDGANGTMYYSKNGANYQAQFTVSPSPLPVSLKTFEAKREGADALLTWETATEVNNKGFEVQASTDGKTFQKLTFVAPETGNSTTSRRYRYLDTRAGKQGTQYYRLRQLDVDGKENFYGPRIITFEGAQPGKARLVAAPNPFVGNELTLTLTSTEAARTGTLVVTDALGRTAYSQPLTVAAGASQLQLPSLEQLPKGLYYVRLSLNGELQSAKVLKQ